MSDLVAEPGDVLSKGERTRRRLLELAIERFGDRGFRSTSVSEIARAAGLSQAAVYAYFANKEELFVAAIDEDANALIGESRAEVDGTPIGNLLPAYLVAFFARLDRHPLARRVLAGQEPEVIGRLLDLPALQRWTALLEADLRLGQVEGVVRDDVDAHRLAAGIEALMLSLLFATVQLGGLSNARHQAGVVEAFDALLRPAG